MTFQPTGSQALHQPLFFRHIPQASPSLAPDSAAGAFSSSTHPSPRAESPRRAGWVDPTSKLLPSAASTGEPHMPPRDDCDLRLRRAGLSEAAYEDAESFPSLERLLAPASREARPGRGFVDAFTPQTGGRSSFLRPADDAMPEGVHDVILQEARGVPSPDNNGPATSMFSCHGGGFVAGRSVASKRMAHSGVLLPPEFANFVDRTAECYEPNSRYSCCPSLSQWTTEAPEFSSSWSSDLFTLDEGDLHDQDEVDADDGYPRAAMGGLPVPRPLGPPPPVSTLTLSSPTALLSSAPEWQAQFYKTKLCPFFVRDIPDAAAAAEFGANVGNASGVCTNGGNCRFAHALNELRPLPDLRKTKLCTSYTRRVACKNSRCPFAHSPQELRTSSSVFYKVTLCNFYKNGRCWNGANCRFAHGSEELRSAVVADPDSGEWKAVAIASADDLQGLNFGDVSPPQLPEPFMGASTTGPGGLRMASARLPPSVVPNRMLRPEAPRCRREQNGPLGVSAKAPTERAKAPPRSKSPPGNSKLAPVRAATIEGAPALLPTPQNVLPPPAVEELIWPGGNGPRSSNGVGDPMEDGTASNQAGMTAVMYEVDGRPTRCRPGTAPATHHNPRPPSGAWPAAGQSKEDSGEAESLSSSLPKQMAEAQHQSGPTISLIVEAAQQQPNNQGATASRAQSEAAVNAAAVAAVEAVANLATHLHQHQQVVESLNQPAVVQPMVETAIQQQQSPVVVQIQLKQPDTANQISAAEPTAPFAVGGGTTTLAQASTVPVLPRPPDGVSADSLPLPDEFLAQLSAAIQGGVGGFSSGIPPQRILGVAGQHQPQIPWSQTGPAPLAASTPQLTETAAQQQLLERCLMAALASTSASNHPVECPPQQNELPESSEPLPLSAGQLLAQLSAPSPSDGISPGAPVPPGFSPAELPAAGDLAACRGMFTGVDPSSRLGPEAAPPAFIPLSESIAANYRPLDAALSINATSSVGGASHGDVSMPSGGPDIQQAAVDLFSLPPECSGGTPYGSLSTQINGAAENCSTADLPCFLEDPHAAVLSLLLASSPSNPPACALPSTTQQVPSTAASSVNETPLVITAKPGVAASAGMADHSSGQPGAPTAATAGSHLPNCAVPRQIFTALTNNLFLLPQQSTAAASASSSMHHQHSALGGTNPPQDPPSQGGPPKMAASHPETPSPLQSPNSASCSAPMAHRLQKSLSAVGSTGDTGAPGHLHNFESNRAPESGPTSAPDPAAASAGDETLKMLIRLLSGISDHSPPQ